MLVDSLHCFLYFSFIVHILAKDYGNIFRADLVIEELPQCIHGFAWFLIEVLNKLALDIFLNLLLFNDIADLRIAMAQDCKLVHHPGHRAENIIKHIDGRIGASIGRQTSIIDHAHAEGIGAILSA